MPIEQKILHSLSDLDQWLAKAPRPLVFTNGCFDLLHRGHVSYLQDAAKLGQSLLVAVNSDASVRGLDKGAERPLNTAADRMAVLAALESVAAVIEFDQATPLELILRCQPEHLVKGGDWPLEEIVGYAEVTQAGGEVHSLPFEFDRSTTQLVEKIRGAAK